MAMAGDYTGGYALASMLDGEPILGVHEVTPDKGMSLWLIKSEMEYVMPSTEDVIVEANIPTEIIELTNKRYHAGSTILLDVDISFKNPTGKDVAKGKFRYYCKKKASLTPTDSSKKMNIMFEHIIKTSAKLIARLRFEESLKIAPLFIDEIAGKVAGNQGKVIADRFMELLPELQNMVAARTYHLDKTIEQSKAIFKNIVFVGVGLDFRIYRNQNDYEGKNIYELDLSEMLSERTNLEIQLNLKVDKINSLTKINCNFIFDSIESKLLDNGFNAQQATLFIFEGCSMYFSENDNKKVFNEIKSLMSSNANSQLWIDEVNEEALELRNDDAFNSLKNFLSKMAILGEPFVNGFNANNHLIQNIGFTCIDKKSALDMMNVPENKIYSLYTFNVYSN
jgi:methyltransferase (TIGR00027 family)